ncbi:glutathione S-transferase [Fopius arisanus]|uniref:glutathione transferase n=1 Tax=Fopius arisanus TaxID=64838 RepID=A0A0C9RHL8_9HYME|nr:PREDICTED: glutathione S-transferase-like [Fopius arisanus]
MPQYRLTYFNVMGLGEPIRFLLSYGGHDFEDIRVDDRVNVWPKMKPSTPFGQLPVLEIDGKMFAQALPICRYLAKPLDLIGKTDLDALQIDAVAAGLHDLRKQVALFYREEDPVLRAKKKEETLKSVVPFYLNKLEELAKNNGGYFHGGQLSYADIFFTAIHDSLANACGIDITEGRPNLKSIIKKVLDIPNIKKWVENRPKLEF